jgi:hypothetical protein
MNATPRMIGRADLEAAAATLGVPVEVVLAVRAAESQGSGFIRGTDLPRILFEAHQFHRLTDGAYDASHPHISQKSWDPKAYVGGRGEYDRLLEAIAATGGDPDPGLKATSWGLFQIMGFNHEAAGFTTVRDFVNAMAEGEDRQLAAFVAFIAAEGLAKPLQGQDWADFARRYNGPGYAKNHYDTRLAAEFAAARRRLDEAKAMGEPALERADVAALQTALNAAIGAGLAVDGWPGRATAAALKRFQEGAGLKATGVADAATLARLGLGGDAAAAAE